MRQLRTPALIFSAVLALAGCATSSLDMAPPRADAPWTPAVNAAGTIQPGQLNSSDGMDYVLPPNPMLAIIPPVPPLDSDRPYTLAELIDLAESNNPQTRISWDAARNAALAAGIAKSSYLPDITASVVGAYQDSSAQNSAAGFSGSGNNEAHGVISAISVKWLLFDFGERAATIQAAKQVSAISNIAFTAAHQQVIYNVSLAFYAYAAARAHTASAAQALQNAQAVQAAAEARYQHGVGTVMEVAQANQATAQAKLVAVQADGGVQDTYLALLTAMGISPLASIEVADLSPRLLSPALDMPLRNIVETALTQRPDMLGAYAAQQASLDNVRAAQAEFLPKIFLSATGAYSSGGVDVTSIPAIGGQQAGTANLSGSHLNGTILAGVTLPLYDGGTRAAILSQAEAGADSAAATLDADRNEAIRQVVGADNTLQTNLAAYDAAQALASASQTDFDAALASYRNGVGSITALIIAETQLLQAKDTETDAYSNTLSSAATLAFSTGALGASPQ